MILSETIVAVSTAPGTGAIAIVRLSGNDSWSIAKRIFFAASAESKNPEFKNAESKKTEWIPGFVLHGFARDLESDEFIDEIVLVPLKGPNTYTGEDIVEINCHGGAVVTRDILNLCLSAGARLARAGEFTERAFLNGKIDLIQAEAVHDIISAKTSKQSRLAVSSLKGELGSKIQLCRAELIELLAKVNAGIDFPEEVGELPLDDLGSIVLRVTETLQRLAATSRSGRFLRDGLRLAIVGKPNAGKSSLLNRLLNFERAIVTDIPGTTRDALEEMFDLRGIPIILTDTAGIRETQDRVEQIGIERTSQAVNEADLILFLYDISSDWDDNDRLILAMIKDHPYIFVGNKLDLEPTNASEILSESNTESWALYQIANTVSVSSTEGHFVEVHHMNEASFWRHPELIEDTKSALVCFSISAKNGQNVETLCDWIEKWALSEQDLKGTGGSLNARQGELCLKSIQALNLVTATIKEQMPQDCLATDLKSAIDNLSEVCGEAVTEELITKVFATFCIGK